MNRGCERLSYIAPLQSETGTSSAAGKGIPRNACSHPLTASNKSGIFTAPASLLLPSPETADVILLVTDGITETRSPEGTMFGEERLFEVARDNRDRPASEIVEAIFAAVHKFSQGAEQQDDNTAVVIKVC
jgi:serine/threonine protein phosphatase PrpC